MEPASSLCLHCGLPIGGRARSRPGGRPFCCTGCALAHEMLGGGTEPGETLPVSLFARFMLAVFLSMGVMIFSLALYADAVYGGEGGHPLGPFAPLCGWLAWGFATPALLLLAVPLLRVERGRLTAGGDRVAGLVLLAVTGAYGLSTWNLLRGEGHVYFETAVMVLLLFTFGRWLEAHARRRANGFLREILDCDPPSALRVDPGGGVENVPAETLRPGDRVRALAGERFAADGIVVSGRGLADESILTGESEPRTLACGDAVRAGTLLLDGSVDFEVDAARGAREIDRLVMVAEDARTRRAPIERKAERVAGLFTPSVLALAAGVFAGGVLRGRGEQALLDGLSVLVVACPCALGIATPLVIWIAVAETARRGVLVRGGEVLEKLAGRLRFFFDKTGTLTEGRLELEGIEPAAGSTLDPGEALKYAASLAAHARHPVCAALLDAARDEGLQLFEVEDVEVRPGLGVSGRIAGRSAVLGRIAYFELLGVRSEGFPSPQGEEEGTYLALSGRLEARIVTRERLRREAQALFRALEGLGVPAHILTGDAPVRAGRVGRELGVAAAGGLLPAEKLEVLERLREPGETAVMVGDGANDVPGLAGADVGVAIGRGGPAAPEAADVVLLEGSGGGDLLRLADLVEIARLSMRKIRANLFWAAAYNVPALGLAAFGRLHPVVAALLMVASSLWVVGTTAGPFRRGLAEVGRRPLRGLGPAGDARRKSPLEESRVPA